MKSQVLEKIIFKRIYSFMAIFLLTSTLGLVLLSDNTVSTSNSPHAALSNTITPTVHYDWKGYNGNYSIYMSQDIASENVNTFQNEYLLGSSNKTSVSGATDVQPVNVPNTYYNLWQNLTSYNIASISTGSGLTFNGIKAPQNFYYYYVQTGTNTGYLSGQIPIIYGGMDNSQNQPSFTNSGNYNIYSPWWSNVSAQIHGLSSGPSNSSHQLQLEVNQAISMLAGYNLSNLLTEVNVNSSAGLAGYANLFHMGLLATEAILIAASITLQFEISIPITIALLLANVAISASKYLPTHIEEVNTSQYVPAKNSTNGLLPVYRNYSITGGSRVLNYTSYLNGTGNIDYYNFTNVWVSGVDLNFTIPLSDFNQQGYLSLGDQNILSSYPGSIVYGNHTRGANDTLNIPISPANIIHGTTYLRGLPTSHESVMITSGNKTEYIVNSNSTGQYRFFAKPGLNYTVQIYGLPYTSKSFAINSTNYKGTLESLYANGSIINGYIKSVNGALLSGESVLIANSSGYSQSFTSNTEGYYVSGPLLDGSYTITLSSDSNQSYNIKIDKLSTYDENFTLSPNIVSGQITTSQQANAGGATVTLNLNGHIYTDNANSNGYYSFSNIIYTGTDTISVSYYTEQGSGSCSFTTVDGNVKTVNIQTQASGGSSDTIAGYVSNPSGSAASGASITIDSQNSLSTTTTNTDSNGYYFFSGITGTGTYYVSISLNGYHGYYTPDVTSISGITYSSNTVLQSISPDTISGTITSYTGADASGASVTLAFDGTTRTTTANSNGHYSFGNIYDTGKYYIDATYDSEPGSGSKIVSAIDGQTLTANIQTAAPVQGGCVLNGTLIMVSQNKAIPVQDLSTGSKILSYDTADGKLVEEKVVSINVTHVTSIFNIDNGLLYVSGATDQPIYVMLPNGTAEWIMVGYLNTSDMIYDPVNNTWVPVTSFTTDHGNYTVYDLTGTKIFSSDGYLRSDYIANGILLDRKI